MANAILILGGSGTGKSFSIRNLPAEETVIINVYGKALPFRGWKKKYYGGSGGNLAVTDTVEGITKTLQYAKDTGKRFVVIDDYQFVAGMKMVREAHIKGYEKFTEIAQNFVAISDEVKKLPSSITVFFLSHIEDDGMGGTKAKTAGKMVDNTIGFEALFTIVLQTTVADGNYGLEVKNNGKNTVKSPLGMFPADVVPNDLAYISDCVVAYDEDEEAPALPKYDEFGKVVGSVVGQSVKTSEESVVPVGVPSSVPVTSTPVETASVPVSEPVSTSTIPTFDIPEPTPPAVDIVVDNNKSDKAIVIADALGGLEVATAFLRSKLALKEGEELATIPEGRLNRLYNNLEQLKAIQKGA